jgi:hypothetical protein
MSAMSTVATTRYIAIAFAATLCACAHAPTDPRERLSWYREHAGAPVSGFDYVRNMRWEALGNQALAVWPRRDAGFLLQMVSPCPGLDDARAIQISHADGRVRARMDSVRVMSMPGSPPMQRQPCPIQIIHEIREPPAESTRELRDIEP